MIEQTIFQILSADPGVLPLVTSSSLPNVTRVYPVILPTSPTLPAISYLIVGGSSQPTMDTNGMLKTRFEINSWGVSYSDAVTLRAAVFNALSEYTDPVANIYISALMPRDFYDYELQQFRAMSEWYVFHTDYAP